MAGRGGISADIGRVRGRFAKEQVAGTTCSDCGGPKNSVPALLGRSFGGSGLCSLECQAVWSRDIGDGGDDLSRHAEAADGLVARDVWLATQKNGASALGLQRVLGLESYKTDGPAAQVPACDGAAGPGRLTSRRGRRDLSA